MSVQIGEDPLALAPLLASVTAPEFGALASFLGVVRATSNDPRPVVALRYEAYAPMALDQMRAIVAEAIERFGPCEVALAHRVGELVVGEASIALAVGAPHRGSAFAACAYIVDELKQRVEIMKQERYADGTSRWREKASRHA